MYSVQVHRVELTHVAEHRELVDVVPDALQLREHFFEAVHDHHLLTETALGDVVTLGEVSFLGLGPDDAKLKFGDTDN